MDRPTPGRALMAMPYHMIRAVIENRPLRITDGTLKAGADFISSEDIGSILPRLLVSSKLSHDIYNVAYGQFTLVPEVFQSFKSIVPEFDYEVVIPEFADIIRDPSRRLARWNAYDIERLSTEFDWKPRPIAEQLASYFAVGHGRSGISLPTLTSRKPPYCLNVSSLTIKRHQCRINDYCNLCQSIFPARMASHIDVYNRVVYDGETIEFAHDLLTSIDKSHSDFIDFLKYWLDGLRFYNWFRCDGQ